MERCKLQIGCLLILGYIIVVYIKDSLNKKVNCNPFFDALLIVSPWAVIFDGVTAWTVNHPETVPEWLNLLLHALFLLAMHTTIVLTYLYILNDIYDIARKKRYLLTAMIPSVLAAVGILAFLPKLYYVEGVTTNYSMGVSVIICYASLLLHFVSMLALLAIRHRYVEKRSLVSSFSYMILVLLVLLVQVIWPESLISSIFPVVTVIGLYVSFEDPSYQRLQAYNADMVTGFATLVENRDQSTGGHIRRTKGYVDIILRKMRHDPRYRPLMTKDYMEHVRNAAPMHDIGKISTPDEILLKPGRLTAEEFDVMKSHAAQGGRIINDTFADLDDPAFQKIAYEVARHHHEKWNGKGYPDGLSGEKIPLHARIMAIADVFDAVSAKRCYRDALPLETCFDIIEKGAGTDFDPELVRLFMESRGRVTAMYKEEMPDNGG